MERTIHINKLLLIDFHFVNRRVDASFDIGALNDNESMGGSSDLNLPQQPNTNSIYHHSNVWYDVTALKPIFPITVLV